ncbi:MAG: AAA family ATPase [Candidatus Helarchaeota archaeon]|nr:AAA family ATPase [Candidatus Helarchaeota archaeon]
MSDKDSEKEEFAIKRITTPHGDVPTVESLMEALNLIVGRINAISKDFNNRMKYSGATIEASEYIEQNLSDTNKKINNLKNKLATNSDQIEEINTNVMKLDDVITNLERMTKNIVNADFLPQSKSMEDIIEIKRMTKTLKDSIIELQKSLGEGALELEMLYWEYTDTRIKENLADIVAYESEKNKILNFFKILNLPKPVLDIDAKILLYGPSGTGKSSLLRAIAKDQKVKIVELNLPLIISLRPPKQVESLNSLFYNLKDKEEFKPCVLLMDNFEMIQKIQDNSLYLPFIETLILEMGRIHLTKDKILVIAILNGIEPLEKHLLDQFNEKVEIKFPDQISRALILRKMFNEINLEMDLDMDEISSKLAEPVMTEGFSGNDFKEVMNIAKLQAFVEGKTLLNEKNLDDAIQVIKSRKELQKSSEDALGLKGDSDSKVKIQHLEDEISNVKMLLANSTRMMKHALRLALTDNYNFINRLFNHYEATKKTLKIKEIAQVTGLTEENVLKILKKMPYKLLFPKIGDQYYVIFDKTTLEEILAELALAI